MDSSHKLSSFGVGLALSALLVGCGTGNDDPEMNSGGGSPATGGSPSSAGSANTAAGTANAGTANAVTNLFTFDIDAEQFTLNTTPSTDPMYPNLADPAVSGSMTPTLGWTGSRDFDPGAVNKGCLMLTATFTAWNQSLSAEVAGPVDKDGVPLDLTDKVLRAQIYLEKGLSPFTDTDAPGGVVFFIKSGTTYAWGQAPWTNLQKYGSWVSVKFNTSNPDPGSSADWDPSNPVQLGFQISAGGGNKHTAEEFGEPLETSVCIDNVTVQAE
jgi:hypothetical protein